MKKSAMLMAIAATFGAIPGISLPRSKDKKWNKPPKISAPQRRRLKQMGKEVPDDGA